MFVSWMVPQFIQHFNKQVFRTLATKTERVGVIKDRRELNRRSAAKELRKVG